MPFDPSQITLEADAKEFIRRYDARCKRILSNRMVLAHLLRATMDEFAGMEAEETRSISMSSKVNRVLIAWTNSVS
ncbi:MAG: hypothetical protein IIY06_08285 [Proteobacteria bacterium]|jgi:hypothetical protein|nr:hypothetical protein [Pseudomonadota bacterium]